MKQFIWLILLIGIISFTGFGATIDLPENSDIVAVDVDVGIDVAIVAIQIQKTITLKSELWIERFKANQINYPISISKIYINFKGKEKISNLYKSAKQGIIMVPYRTPRDGLNC